LFAKLAKNRNIEDQIVNVGGNGSGGGAPAVATPAGGVQLSAAPIAKENKSRRDIQDILKQRVQRLRIVFDGAFGEIGDEEVVVGEGVVVTSSSLEMLKNSCLGEIMVNLIFLEGFEEEELVEFMVEFG
ncbi:hypothetical protein Tco_0120891, partial [Tanacetum coccineum]